jgi:hypothetical protein
MSLYDLVALMRRFWIRMLAGLVFGVAGGLLAAYLLPAYYRAQIVVAPASELSGGGGTLSALASQLGGLSSLAGISLGGGVASRTAINLETMRGQSFLVDFAKRRGLVVPMFAGGNWNFKKGAWEIDGSRYDQATGIWLTSRWRTSGDPTDSEIYSETSKRIDVDEDRRSGVIRVVVESRSPIMAARWARWIIDDINENIRKADIAEAHMTIDYLGQQIRSTPVAEMQAIFYRLVEEQTKSLMLAQVRDEYAFRVIDEPLVPSKRVWPSRTWATLLGALCGLATAALSFLLPMALTAPASRSSES